MVDSGRCKVLYEGNEDEYEEYYDFGGEGEGQEGMDVDGGAALAVSGADGAAAGNGYELALPSGQPGGAVRLLGSREFARYYRQRHRFGDSRESAVAARLVAQYRRLAVPLLGDGTSEGIAQAKRGQNAVQRADRVRLQASMRRNTNDNLPRNVPF
jgi:pre-60S factor REI1